MTVKAEAILLPVSITEVLENQRPLVLFCTVNVRYSYHFVCSRYGAHSFSLYSTVGALS